MRRLLVLLCLVGLSMALPRHAAADATAFIGMTPTPDSRLLRGFAFGFGVLVVGFEFEYANSLQDADEGLPSLVTGSANILLQTPIEVSGISLYGTAGGGLYRERLLARQETSLSTNVGGGAKIRLAGPLRLRLDYRVFRLQGDPLHQTYHRVYAGANLAF
jgi:hypothetical protein